MNKVTRYKGNLPKKNKTDLDDNLFKWRSQDGRKTLIYKMHTRHLFNTVVMIWNHTMPAEAWTTPIFKRYRFTGIYTDDYKMAAVQNMLPELLTRKDLTEYQQKILDKMARYFAKKVGHNLTMILDQSKVKSIEEIKDDRHTTD